MPFIFSYGSNGEEQMSSRLGRKARQTPAYLENHKRVYRGQSRTWNSGVASLKKKVGSAVYGSLTKISGKELRILDRYEGAEFAYTRKQVYVRSAVSTKPSKGIFAWVYISCSNQHNKPSLKYLKAMTSHLNQFWRHSSGRKLKPSDFDIS